MSRIKLKDIAVEKNERVDNPSESPYSIFVGLEHYDSGEATIRRYGSTEMLESTMKVFHAGDILVARRNVYLRRAATVDFDGLTSGDSIVLHVEKEAYRRIVPFVLNTDDFWNYANQHADGSMSKRLSPKLLMEYEFSVPEKDLEKTTEILWAMERTKNAYRELIAKTDDLVKSQFIEMFGDPEKNTLGLDYVQLGDIAFITKLAGFEYTKYIKYQDSGDIIMIRGLNCKGTKLVLDDLKWIDRNTSNMLPRSKLNKGDIVITYVGTVGEIGLIDKDDTYHLAPNVAKLSLNDKSKEIPAFWAYMLMISRDYLVRFATSTTQAALNMERIRYIGFINPPTEQQEQFVELLEQSDKSKFELTQAISRIDDMIKALMQG